MKEIEVKQNIRGCCSQTAPSSQNERKDTKDKLPIAIIGAGPIGLAAAAHLTERGERFILFESGSQVGSNILEWGHVRLFSPWQYNIDGAAKNLLEKHGWKAPSLEDLPLGKELVEQYLEPVANLPEIKPFILLETKVSSVSRKGMDKMKTFNRENVPFEICVEKSGVVERYEARAVVDASGTWGHPNPVYANGVWKKEEQELSEKIFYGIPDVKGKDRVKYAGKRVSVVGGGHSALNTIVELVQLKEVDSNTEIIWIMRKKNVEEAYGGEEKDALQARGELGVRIHQLVDSGQIQVINSYRIQQLVHKDNRINIIGYLNDDVVEIEKIDNIIVNTGSRPDFSFLREIRLRMDSTTESVAALASLIDPNIHSCGTVRPHGEQELRQLEKDFYVVGSKSYGRAPTFLMATGYEQVRSIAAYLTGDFEGAKKVELDLPETGVCSLSIISTREAEDLCCNLTSNC
ncbi:NAD(P)-binding domain-containing protein [Bacillus sp. PK3_68]|uniref:NAD(P)-binding domain-containing protein n=1 Tax=Bacillus sp. PK3_68 TaxID=2027408 RepID=UPI000E70EB4A|nr:NAD(P)-binding domain-containing protein [Bacillus sp. PK3_68]RJS59262.1 glutamate synthase [Bacillus sp. PK3_68]